MMKKTVVLIIIIILLISIFIVLTKNEENPSFLKSGDSINVSGTISSVEYMNTTYGKIPFLSIDSIIDIFKKANLWDPEIYELTGSEEPAGLEIMGGIDKKYSPGEKINVTLHFQKIVMSNAQTYWFKEVALYIRLHLSLCKIMETVLSQSNGFYLVQKTEEDNCTIYEIVGEHNQNFTVDSINISLKKLELSDEKYGDNITFLNAMKNLIYSFSRFYNELSAFSMYNSTDYIGGKFVNYTIEVLDENENNILDEGDVIKVHLPPTMNETVLQNYFMVVKDNKNNTTVIKYLLNWYKGPIDIIE